MVNKKLKQKLIDNMREVSSFDSLDLPTVCGLLMKKIYFKQNAFVVESQIPVFTNNTKHLLLPITEVFTKIAGYTPSVKEYNCIVDTLLLGDHKIKLF